MYVYYFYFVGMKKNRVNCKHSNWKVNTVQYEVIQITLLFQQKFALCDKHGWVFLSHYLYLIKLKDLTAAEIFFTWKVT